MAHGDTRLRSALRAPKRVPTSTIPVSVEGMTPGDGLVIVGNEVRLAVDELPKA